MKTIETLALETNEATTTYTLLPASERVALADAADAAVEHTDSIDDLVKHGTIDSFTAVNLLETLEDERKNWEGSELAASHSRLYSILSECYAYYLTMKAEDSPKQLRAQMAQGLDRFINMRNLRTLDKTHDMNRVVKAVFGEDRRRVSAYSMALRVALTAGVGAKPLPSSELAGWIEKNGGIEEIRQGSKGGGMTAKERAGVAATAVKDTPLMTFKPDTKVMAFGSDDADRMMVLVVTYRPTGDIEVNSVIKSGAVLRAALAAHYATHKEQMAKAKASEELAQPTAISMALGKKSD